MNIRRELLTVPNLLTSFRFVCAPVLLLLAWQGRSAAFLLLLAAAFLSDVLDGMIARLTNQVSRFGAVLDSWADMITYVTVTISACWLWPDIVSREAPYVATVIASYLLPVIVGFVKFGALTSYHTWLVKFAAASIGLSFYLLFFVGLALPFRIAAIICVFAAVEEILITLISDELHSDVRSVWDVMRR